MKLNCSRPGLAWTSSKWGLVGLLAGLILPGPLWAGIYSTVVSPPRFELEAKPGEVKRSFLRIGNSGQGPASFRLRSADWDLGPDAGVTIHPVELRADSCRPWVRLERPVLSVPPGGEKKFRFEVRVPEEAGDGECRFAILIEVPEDAHDLVSAGNIKFPVAGRIAVIVYLKIGQAQATLQVGQMQIQQKPQGLVPMVEFHNPGQAHGRPRGLLKGVDGQQRPFSLLVSPLPVLPGETRWIPMWPKQANGDDIDFTIQPPARISGEIIWDGGKVAVEQILN